VIVDFEQVSASVAISPQPDNPKMFHVKHLRRAAISPEVPESTCSVTNRLCSTVRSQLIGPLTVR